jgi:hypothetical protein
MFKVASQRDRSSLWGSIVVNHLFSFFGELGQLTLLEQHIPHDVTPDRCTPSSIMDWMTRIGVRVASDSSSGGSWYWSKPMAALQ